MRMAALVVLVALLNQLSTGQVRSADDRRDGGFPKETVLTGIQPLIEQLARRDQFSGVVLIAKNGKAVFRRVYGSSDLKSHRLNRLDTRFNLASTTKTFTGVAVVQLAQRGKLSFADRLVQFLPDCPVKLQNVTIHQLLTHTAGTGDVLRSEEFRKSPRRFMDLADYLTTVYAQSLVSEPGRQFRYGDSDYILLGAVVEKVSAQSYYDYVRHHVFARAGMKKTGFDLIPGPTDMAVGYTSRNLSQTSYNSQGETKHENSAIFPTIAEPGGGAYSTAGDLLLFANALLTHRLLNPTYTEILLTGKEDTGGQAPNQKYAYGFFDGSIGRTRITNHGGTGPGIDVCFDLYPKLGYTVIVLSNYDPPAAQQIRDKLRVLIAGQ